MIANSLCTLVQDLQSTGDNSRSANSARTPKVDRLERVGSHSRGTSLEPTQVLARYTEYSVQVCKYLLNTSKESQLMHGPRVTVITVCVYTQMVIIVTVRHEP